MTDEKPDLNRRLIEWAIAAGRHFESPQTGYIHYFLHPNGAHHTIPIYENVLFALALLRSRNMENIKEAQNLLSRILVFQNLEEGQSKGNFPYYLHEYPYCRDFAAGILLLAPFYWILKGFGHILGQDLRSKLETAVKFLIDYGHQAQQVRPLSYSLAVRFASALAAFGKLLNRSDWQNSGTHWLEDLGKNPSIDSWHHTSNLGDLFIAWQMAPQDLEMPAWKPLWHFVNQTWHAQLSCYCGPCVSEKQDENKPEANFYDLFMGYLNGHLPDRAQQIKIDLLQAALIHPHSNGWFEAVTDTVVKGQHRGQAWTVIKHPSWSIALLEKTVELSEKREKTFTFMRILWGNHAAVHSLVCQGGMSTRVTYDWDEPKITLTFDLEGDIEGIPEKSREICFYFDYDAAIKPTLNGLRTMTFELEQEVKLHLGEEKEIGISMHLVDGKGDFLGHLSHANRPSQIRQSEDKKAQAYDWILFLRTLRRSGPCIIKAVLDLSKMNG